METILCDQWNEITIQTICTSLDRVLVSLAFRFERNSNEKNCKQFENQMIQSTANIYYYKLQFVSFEYAVSSLLVSIVARGTSYKNTKFICFVLGYIVRSKRLNRNRLKVQIRLRIKEAERRVCLRRYALACYMIIAFSNYLVVCNNFKLITIPGKNLPPFSSGDCAIDPSNFALTIEEHTRYTRCHYIMISFNPIRI